jgi:GDPmannose 4,6-dehydratase
MQWMMLQQDEPEDFVIATGVQHSVREFVETAAGNFGITINWTGTGLDEVGIVESVDTGKLEMKALIKPGDTIIRVDQRYFRPAEVSNLLGDSSKAREKLGWKTKTSFEELVTEMTTADLELATRVKNFGDISWKLGRLENK